MKFRLIAAAALLMAVEGGLAGQEVPPAGVILERHRKQAAGGEDPAKAGDLLFEGTREEGGNITGYRAFVRWKPFGYREELRQGEGLARVFLSDGTRGWKLEEKGGQVEMTGYGAISLVEFAFRARLGHLEPGCAAEAVAAAGTLPDAPGLPPEFARGRVVAGILVSTDAGTEWRYDFDVEDGRLHGVVEHAAAAPRWARFAGWKKAGPLVLPDTMLFGQAGYPFTATWRFTRIEAGLAHAPALFPFPPPPPDEVDAARFEVHHSNIPGSATLIVPGVRVNGRASCTAMIDLGITRVGIDPAFAVAQGVFLAGGDSVRTPAGVISVRSAWIDSLDLERARLAQIPAIAAPSHRSFLSRPRINRR